MLVMTLVAIAGCLACGFGAYKTSLRRWLAKDTPTIASGHLVLGRVELRGKAVPVPGLPLVVSPFDATRCVWWRVELQKETKSGKSRSWKTEYEATSSDRILVDDGSGPAAVVTDKANLRSLNTNTTSESELPADLTAVGLWEIASGKPITPAPPADPEAGVLRRLVDAVANTYTPTTPISTLSGKWRVFESRIVEGEDLYVLGHAAYDEQLQAAALRHDKAKPLFIYAGTQDQLAKKSKWLSVGLLAGAVALAWFALAVARGTAEKVGGNTNLHPAWSKGGPGALGVVVVALVAQGVRIRNRVVAAKEQAEAGAKLVDVALAKRAVLVPQLTEVVRAAAVHEQSLLQALASDQPVAAADALVERYPLLQTQENFLALQSSLVRVENELAVARGFAAEAKTVYDTRRQSFPDWLLARSV